MKINNIAYILRVFPGEPPFIMNEVNGIRDLGVNVIIFTVNNNKNKIVDPSWDKEIFNVFNYLSLDVIRAHIFHILKRPYKYIQLILQCNKMGGWQVFWKAIYYSYIARIHNIQHIHAHFAWDAADMAMMMSTISGISFSFTAHQSDIHRDPIRLKEKIDKAKYVLTCTNGNRDYLSAKYGNKNKIYAIYHGVDRDMFSVNMNADSKDIDIISVGRLIKVKGFDYLIEACARLKLSGLLNKCVIVGDGEEMNNLSGLVKQYGLEDKIELKGAVPYKEIIILYQRAKIFALTATVIDGAPHGIPNVIAEGMAMGLPVIAFDVPHINELIENGINGILVPDKNIDELVKSIKELLNNNEERKRLGSKAINKVSKCFDLKEQNRKILDLFNQSFIR